MTTFTHTLTAALHLAPVLIVAAVIFTAVCLAFREES